MGKRQNPFRVIVLSHGGCELVVERLTALAGVEIAGIFVETDVVRRYTSRQRIIRSIQYDGYSATAMKLARQAFLRNRRNPDVEKVALDRNRLVDTARSHGVPLHLVANYHDDEALQLMRHAAPDLGIIYGTNIIKESVFEIPRLGSINLHQGLAPYYRGGPPVFWELFNGEEELGLTVHFVAKKVDAGEIVVQKRVPLDYEFAKYETRFESFISDYTEQLKLECADLMAEAVNMIALGAAQPKPQDISLGKRYRLPLKREKDELRRRLRGRYARMRHAEMPAKEPLATAATRKAAADEK